MSDGVDKAIEASEKPQPVALEERQLTISSSGRPFVFAHPPDITETELFEVIGWMAHVFRQQMAKRRAQQPASRLWVPGSGKPT